MELIDLAVEGHDLPSIDYLGSEIPVYEILFRSMRTVFACL